MVLEKKIFKNAQCIFTLFLLPPLGEGQSLHLNKAESPSPKDDLIWVWLKLAQWFWRRRLLNDPTPFPYFCDYLPFEEVLAIYLNKLEFTSSKDNMYQVWLNLVCWFWRTRFKNFLYAHRKTGRIMLWHCLCVRPGSFSFPDFFSASLQL
jgi:hypothetical protein